VALAYNAPCGVGLCGLLYWEYLIENERSLDYSYLNNGYIICIACVSSIIKKVETGYVGFIAQYH
jgi:hypothetical protein